MDIIDCKEAHRDYIAFESQKPKCLKKGVGHNAKLHSRIKCEYF